MRTLTLVLLALPLIVPAQLAHAAPPVCVPPTLCVGDVPVAVTGGDSHTCVLLSAGNVRCWGSNQYGQTAGYAGFDATGVASAAYTSCVVRQTGNVACWGYNAYGQAAGYSGGDAIAVGGGTWHLCAVKSSGNVECWGRNDYGETNAYTGGNAVTVSGGWYHTCALLTTHNVHCWGRNNYGQSDGYSGGDAIAMAAGDFHTCVLRSNGNVVCFGVDATSGYSGGDAIAIASGDDHSCALRSNGNVTCWGFSYFGADAPYTGGDAVAIGAGEEHNCVIRADGRVYCWGLDDSLQAQPAHVELATVCVSSTCANVGVDSLIGLPGSPGGFTPYTCSSADPTDLAASACAGGSDPSSGTFVDASAGANATALSVDFGVAGGFLPTPYACFGMHFDSWTGFTFPYCVYVV